GPGRLAGPIPAVFGVMPGLAEQRRGVYEVRRREAFGPCAMDGRQRGAGLVAAALPLPEPGKAHRRPQLPRPAPLAPCPRDPPAETGFGPRPVPRRSQKQFALEAVQLGLLKAVVVLLRQGQALSQGLARLLEQPFLGTGLSQDA